jgi:hypothetical protein
MKWLLSFALSLPCALGAQEDKGILCERTQHWWPPYFYSLGYYYGRIVHVGEFARRPDKFPVDTSEVEFQLGPDSSNNWKILYIDEPSLFACASALASDNRQVRISWTQTARDAGRVIAKIVPWDGVSR